MSLRCVLQKLALKEGDGLQVGGERERGWGVGRKREGGGEEERKKERELEVEGAWCFNGGTVGTVPRYAVKSKYTLRSVV
jgi:hypothetical protein